MNERRGCAADVAADDGDGDDEGQGQRTAVAVTDRRGCRCRCTCGAQSSRSAAPDYLARKQRRRQQLAQESAQMVALANHKSRQVHTAPTMRPFAGNVWGSNASDYPTQSKSAAAEDCNDEFVVASTSVCRPIVAAAAAAPTCSRPPTVSPPTPGTPLRGRGSGQVGREPISARHTLFGRLSAAADEVSRGGDVGRPRGSLRDTFGALPDCVPFEQQKNGGGQPAADWYCRPAEVVECNDSPATETNWRCLRGAGDDDNYRSVRVCVRMPREAHRILIEKCPTVSYARQAANYEAQHGRAYLT